MISLIAALTRDSRAIGYKNQLLWRLPGDLPRFKNLTLGHPIIMGRKTYESIGRPLPGRTNIVISQSLTSDSKEIIVCRNLIEAIEKAKACPGQEEIFIIGGGQVYTEALPLADRLYLTVVEKEFEADTFFPSYQEFKTVIEKEDHHDNDPPFQYITLEK